MKRILVPNANQVGALTDGFFDDFSHATLEWSSSNDTGATSVTTTRASRLTMATGTTDNNCSLVYRIVPVVASGESCIADIRFYTHTGWDAETNFFFGLIDSEKTLDKDWLVDDGAALPTAATCGFHKADGDTRLSGATRLDGGTLTRTSLDFTPAAATWYTLRVSIQYDATGLATVQFLADMKDASVSASESGQNFKNLREFGSDDRIPFYAAKAVPAGATDNLPWALAVMLKTGDTTSDIVDVDYVSFMKNRT